MLYSPPPACTPERTDYKKKRVPGECLKTLQDSICGDFGYGDVRLVIRSGICGTEAEIHGQAML